MLRMKIAVFEATMPTNSKQYRIANAIHEARMHLYIKATIQRNDTYWDTHTLGYHACIKFIILKRSCGGYAELYNIQYIKQMLYIKRLDHATARAMKIIIN